LSQQFEKVVLGALALEFVALGLHIQLLGAG
jgi:hypothetical protein